MRSDSIQPECAGSGRTFTIPALGVAAADGFPGAGDRTDFTIQDVYRTLATDATRNQQIVTDIAGVCNEDRTPLVLTNRTDHLDRLAEGLAGVENVFVLKGGMGKKQRQAVADQLAAIPDGVARILLATGSYIGVGFDDPKLDTLFLAMPISWRGTFQQYVGRLHRIHQSAAEVAFGFVALPANP